MTSLTEALDRLAPIPEWEDDWADVLHRAGEDGRPLGAPRRVWRRRLGRRRVVLLAFAVAAVIAPLTALAAIDHWWFLRTSLPRPTQKPIVVTRGSWSGHRWTLAAYPSYPSAKGYGLCWGITFSGRTPRSRKAPQSPVIGSPGLYFSGTSGVVRGSADGFGCGSIVGIQIGRTVPANTPTVAFESHTTTAPGYPSWIAGAVVATATHAVIRWQTGMVSRVATFAAPVAGYHVRLFAATIPKQLAAGPLLPLASIGGTDPRGRVVGCFNPAANISGLSPLSSCKP